MIEQQNRELNIEEILSKQYSVNVIVDVYEYYMRKCNWNISTLQSGVVKDFLLCVLFQSEIEYGGFLQFFSDETGDMTDETVDALKKIDEFYSDILTRVIRLFPGGTVEKGFEKRIKCMENFDEETRQCLDELRKIILERGWDFNSKLFDFLQEHKAVF